MSEYLHLSMQRFSMSCSADISTKIKYGISYFKPFESCLKILPPVQTLCSTIYPYALIGDEVMNCRIFVVLIIRCFDPK